MPEVSLMHPEKPVENGGRMIPAMSGQEGAKNLTRNRF